MLCYARLRREWDVLFGVLLNPVLNRLGNWLKQACQPKKHKRHLPKPPELMLSGHHRSQAELTLTGQISENGSGKRKEQNVVGRLPQFTVVPKTGGQCGWTTRVWAHSWAIPVGELMCTGGGPRCKGSVCTSHILLGLETAWLPKRGVRN